MPGERCSLEGQKTGAGPNGHPTRGKNGKTTGASMTQQGQRVMHTRYSRAKYVA